MLAFYSALQRASAPESQSKFSEFGHVEQSFKVSP
jgi:hypothetical protein